MRFRILGLMAAGLLAACSSGTQSDVAQMDGASSDRARSGATTQPVLAASAAAVRTALGRTADAGFAPLPDRGDLVAYDSARKVRKTGAYTWHPVALSEAHAMNAVGPGRELVLTAPNGQPIRLAYERHVEHKDGNWTWVGREKGAQAGTEAIITFGEKAAFGSIPYGDQAPLRLNIVAGQAWLVETDNKLIAASNSVGAKPRASDTVLLRTGEKITLGPNAAASAPASLGTAEAAAATPTVDVLIGYTNGFAARLGGQSQAMTRLNFLVDVTNQAYANAQIPGRVRLVHAMQVTYADATSNEDALYALTGFTCDDSGCDPTPIPAALQPLHTARNTYGADLVSLVRVFNDPENDSCGIAWLNGGGRVAITSDDEIAGMSVVSDSSGNLFPDDGYYCRDETFAHEVGHNMGSAHDIDTSDGDNNILEDDEYGAYTYSFGQKTDVGNGNFYTVMAYGDSGQTKYRLFSNPRINSCGGFACGVTNLVDNARSLTNTMPIAATFRATAVVDYSFAARNDFNGDGRSDLMWRYTGATTPNVRWSFMNGITRSSSYYQTLNTAYRVVATGDFNGDGKVDLVWRSGSASQLLFWMSNNGTSFTAAWLTGLGAGWNVVGAGDINADGKSDLLWHYGTYQAGNFQYWLLNGPIATSKVSLTMGSGYRVVAAGDFNGDHKLDILWQSGTTNSYRMWVRGTSGFTGTSFAGPGTGWTVAGAGDVNNDDKADIVWYLKQNVASNFRYWVMNGATKVSQKSYSQNAGYSVAALGDYDGNGQLDVVWRASQSTNLRMWRNFGGTIVGGDVVGYGTSWSVIPGN
jgi:uncharacterized protein (DUF2141 family)